MRIYVTEKDIREGIKQSTTSCPVARAVARKLKINSVRVGTSFITCGDKQWKMPEKVYQFIEAFDGRDINESLIKRFSFTLAD